jgi:hypothetical protein
MSLFNFFILWRSQVQILVQRAAIQIVLFYFSLFTLWKHQDNITASFHTLSYSLFTYNPTVWHCFITASDSIIKSLISVCKEECLSVSSLQVSILLHLFQPCLERFLTLENSSQNFRNPQIIVVCVLLKNCCPSIEKQKRPH